MCRAFVLLLIRLNRLKIVILQHGDMSYQHGNTTKSINKAMSNNFFADAEFKNEDFSAKPLTKGHYENCSFTNCSFNQATLIDIVFTECEFNQCDLSLANLTNATLRDLKFIGCKLVGLHFESCNDILFSVQFENCNLNLTSFYQRNMKKTIFKDCKLNETDFTETNLNEASFKNCDLAGSVFEYTQLEKADFRTSFNYIIDPENNKISKAKFDASGLKGLLMKYNIIVD